MTDIYTRMQGTATRLLTQYVQGTVIYVQPGAVSGDAWNPVQGVAVEHTLQAAVKGVSKEYVDGTTVLSTDLMVTSAVFDVEPSLDGQVKIDGKLHQIIKVMPKPAAGTVVAWGVIVRG